MKIITTAALIFTFLFFLAAYSQSEDHYIYKDAQGKLVISNQQPPAGSNVLRKFDLPEFREAQIATSSRDQQHPFNRQVGKPSETGTKEITIVPPQRRGIGCKPLLILIKKAGSLFAA